MIKVPQFLDLGGIQDVQKLPEHLDIFPMEGDVTSIAVLNIL